MQAELDKIDKHLLTELQRNADLSAARLGEIVGLSQAACWRRIQRLESDGYISRKVAIVDPEKIGLGTLVLAHVKLTAHGRANLDAFSETIKKIPNVLECFVLMGDQDFFLKVAVRDVYEYERLFFQTLSTIDGVAEVRSAMALSRIKNETAYPL